MKKCLLIVTCMFMMMQAKAWEIKGNKIRTRWAKEVSPENAWKEYPRPQLKRGDWKNLNGLWEYAVTPITASLPSKYDGEILVPFCIESALSGVAKEFKPTDKLWYKRKFTLDPSWEGQNIILQFGAVDFEATVWVNGQLVGTHRGGSNAFNFDITKFLKGKKEQTLVVSVTDPTDTESYARGKQKLDPQGIWYTPVSGIWKTVWIEPVGKTYIQGIYPESDIDNGRVKLQTGLAGSKGNETLQIRVTQNGKEILSKQMPYASSIELNIPEAKLWTPEQPNLYHLDVTLNRSGRKLDQVKTYFAMRKVSKGKDALGYNRVFLNNRPVFQYGPLDQGWWPDGLLTPPSVNAICWEMEQLKAMGFNTIRKHIKVEPDLYYYYADSLGFMVWQDMPSGFATERRNTEHIQHTAKEDWNAPKKYADQWEKELNEMIAHLRFFPSITTWVVFNEGWGQHETVKLVNSVMQLDKSRLINGVTGWTDRNVGDFYDVHNYPSASMMSAALCPNRISVLGEFGGLGLPVKDHLWNPGMRNWGYKTIDESSVLVSDYTRLMYDLEVLIPKGLAAAIYTQTTDVEGEVNGLMTYDREIVKIPVPLLHQLHTKLYTLQPKLEKVLIATAESQKQKRDIVLNKKSLSQVEMPLTIKAEDSVVSEINFTLKEIPEQLLFKILSQGDAKVWINGVKVFEAPIRGTRQHNQYNITDYISALKVGVNKFRIELNNTTKGIGTFDYGLSAF